MVVAGAATARFLAELAVVARLGGGGPGAGRIPSSTPCPGRGVRAPMRHARTPPVGGSFRSQLPNCSKPLISLRKKQLGKQLGQLGNSQLPVGASP